MGSVAYSPVDSGYAGIITHYFSSFITVFGPLSPLIIKEKSDHLT